MKIRRFKNKEEAKKAAQKALVELFSKYKNTPILFLSSGGSSFELLDGLSILNKKHLITIGMLDERYTENEEISNFLQMTKTKFFFEMLTGGAMLIDTSLQSKESLLDMAERFNASLKGWRTIHPNGIIIATVGIGKDGHIAGIMSKIKKDKFKELFNNEDVYVVGYNTGKNSEDSNRVTVNLSFLRLIDHSVSYVVGKKKNALTSIIKRHGDITETPARIIRDMKDVTIFTDIDK